MAANNDAELPRTIEDAVDLVFSRFSDELKAYFRKCDDEMEGRVAIAKSMVAGMSVRRMLGLWDNPELLVQCYRNAQYPVYAASSILVECWRRLRATSEALKRPGPAKRKGKA